MEEPPPLVLFPTLDSYLSALDPETRVVDEGELRKLHALGLPPVASTRSLGVLFGYRPQFIGTMRLRPHRYYNRYEIRKGRKTRHIQAPRVAIKVIQKWFGHYFSRAYKFPDYVIGFVPGRSSIGGAATHCKQNWIFSTDIENFFQTTSTSCVTQSLIDAGYSIPAAELIADLNCISGALAQGSPASPVLANISMLKVDSQIQKLANEAGARFTRYADDIVLSGCGTPPSGITEKIQRIFDPTSWKIAEHKTRLVQKPNRLKVHGLLVNGDRPRLTKGYRKRIRAIQHLLENDKIPEAELARARGHLAYAQAVEKFEPLDGRKVT